MLLRIWRALTVLLLALAMGLAWAHLLEMPQKMQLEPWLYLVLAPTLYPYFAYVGGPAEVAAVLCCIVLCVLVRKRRPALVLASIAAICAAAALGVWLARVSPMNAEMSRWVPSAIPSDWTRVRDQWEHGHALRALLWSLALALVTFAE